MSGFLVNLSNHEPLRELRETGTTAHAVADRMVSIHECFDTMELPDMLALDASYAG